jgi:hypothetical protein
VNERPRAPWTTAQARAVGACDLVAALVVATAALLAGGEDALQDQVTWVNLAVLGLLLAMVANGCWLLLARRAVGRRRLELVPDVVARARPKAATVTTAGWLWLPGTSRAHVHGCQMILGKPAEEISADGIRSNRLSRCELCG